MRLALLLMAGCGATMPGPNYVPTGADAVLIDRVVAEWADTDGLTPLGPACEESRARLRVAMVGGEDFRDVCGRCEPGHCPGYQATHDCPYGCASECVTYLSGAPYIVIHPSYEGTRTWGTLIAHGAIHVLAGCAGQRVGHEDERVWGADGVQHRALGYLP